MGHGDWQSFRHRNTARRHRIRYPSLRRGHRRGADCRHLVRQGARCLRRIRCRCRRAREHWRQRRRSNADRRRWPGRSPRERGWSARDPRHRPPLRAVRGVGGSSPRRSLVLADGMPLNDAFGGWVFWDKVPQAAIDRIEVDRGSGGDLYGADALGGVIQLLTVRPARATGRVMLEGGTQGTGTVSVFGGGRANDWRYSGAGEWFNTDGYIP